MGLFDNLFKPKSPPSEENSVETGAKPAEPAKHSDAAGRSTASDRPDPSAFLHPKSFVPRGVSPLAAAGKPGAPPGVRKPGPPPPPARDEIVLTLGDVLSRIPTPYLKQGIHDPKRELRFSINDLSSDIARGRAAVPLSRIAQLVPDIFVKQISRDEDTEIRLPLQKLVEQIGLLRSRPGGRQAGGATTLTLPGPYPLQMTDTAAPGRETLRGLMSVVEPVFEFNSTETAELLTPLEEEPPLEPKPAAEPLIVQFPLAAGTPEVETPPDLVEEDTTTPEPEVAEPVPSPAKEVAAAPRVEETPAKVSESFEALVARLERESAAKFSEAAAAHAEAPPAAAKETTLPAAESLFPTVESTSPPTEHAVDAKPDQPLAEPAAPKVEPQPSRGEDPSPVAEAILSKAEAALVEPLQPVARPAASVAEPTTPVAESAAPSTTAPTRPPEGTATESTSVPAPIEAAAASPVSALPAAESGASAVAPETLSVPAPLPGGETLPPAVPVAETIGKLEMAAEAPAAPAGERTLAPGVKVQERPVIATPKVRELSESTEAGGEKIQLSLAAILRQCPREIIVGEMPHVPDSVRITLPFAPIDRQLVQGHVEISAVRFVAAIPFIYQKHFSARMGVKVPIPLEEVFQNLPSAAAAEPAAPGPTGQILAPAFPEENALAAVENLPPMAEAIELAPAPAGVAPAKAMDLTGIESVMAMLKAEIPPPFQRATESPKGVEMPPLESTAEAPKAAEPATGERVGPKPVEAVTLEIARPAPVEPPPLQRAAETPQGVKLPPIGSATEVPKADKPAAIDRTTETAKPAEPLPVEIAAIEPMATEPPSAESAIEAPKGVKPAAVDRTTEAAKSAGPLPVESAAIKPMATQPPPVESATEAPNAVKPAPADRTTEDAGLVEPLPVESATIEPKASEPPPIESATEAPKGIKPARIKKAAEKPKAIKPATTQEALATPEAVQPPPVESASLISMATEPPPAESTGAAHRGDDEQRPTESAVGAAPHAEAPQRVEETPSLPVSSETPQMAAPPGASPMEPTAPEPAPAPLDLPAFHQFTPPPPLIVPEMVEPAPITAIGSAEPKGATPDAPHLVPVPTANESGQLSEGAAQVAETLPSAVGPESMAATLAPESKAPATGPEPHKVEGEPVPSVASLPESESTVRLPEPAGHAVAPEIAVPLVEVKKDGKDTKDEAESKAVEEAPAPTAADPSMSVFAEATQTIRPPQMVRPFIVLPPPIIGFTPVPEKAEEGLQLAENKVTETNITLGAKQEVSLGGEAPATSHILSPEVPGAQSPPFVIQGPVEQVGPTERPAASSSIIDIDFTQALVPPAESIPADLFPATVVVDIGPQTPGPFSEAAGGPAAEVIPPASEQAPAIPVAEKPAGITFVVQGKFTEPLADESAKRSDAGRAVEPRAKEGASEIEAALPIGPAAEAPVEGEVPAVGVQSTTPVETAATVVEPAEAGASEAPKVAESESEPLLHIPQIAAALEAATEILPPALPLRRFDQDALQAIFMTEETLDLAKISRLAAQLPGVHACVIATRDQACTGGTLPEGFDLAALLGLAPRVNEAAGRMPIGDLKHFTLYGERYSISFFARHGLSLCAVHRPRSFVPGVREKLVAIADELSK